MLAGITRLPPVRLAAAAGCTAWQIFGKGRQQRPGNIRCPRPAHQVAARSILWADRSIEVGELANKLGRNFYPCWGPAWPRMVDPAQLRFVGEHDPQTTTVVRAEL